MNSKRVYRALASLRFTLVAFVLLMLGALLAYGVNDARTTTLVLLVPLVLLIVNLLAAVITNSVFRREPALLVFHLALILIVVLVAVGRATYLKGKLELIEGEVFDGQLMAYETGPWHPWNLQNVHFSNEGFRIEYAPGLRRGPTHNLIAWQDSEGRWQRGIIGDQNPLVLSGYRFYTSANKGFSPMFVWQPLVGDAVSGGVHLPGYPVNEYRQSNEWKPPGIDQSIWIQLEFDEVLIDPEQSSEFRMPKQHRLVVRVGEERWVLQPGDTVTLSGGSLTYQGLRTWMGYTVSFDPTPSWLLASCLIAVMALSFHFYTKFGRRPWRATS